MPLFRVSGVDEQRYWPVIDQVHLHFRAKNAGRHLLSAIRFQLLNEAGKQGTGNLRWCRPVPGGAVAFLDRRKEGELADRQNPAAGFKHIAVHDPVLIIEDAQAGISAIHAAGMVAIGIGSEEALPDADFNVPAIGELTLGQILSAEQEAAARGRLSIRTDKVEDMP